MECNNCKGLGYRREANGEKLACDLCGDELDQLGESVDDTAPIDALPGIFDSHEGASSRRRTDESAVLHEYALPTELADYLLRHLRQERAALDGFVALGNEVARAERLDRWIAVLERPNTGN